MKVKKNNNKNDKNLHGRAEERTSLLLAHKAYWEQEGYPGLAHN